MLSDEQGMKKIPSPLATDCRLHVSSSGRLHIVVDRQRLAGDRLRRVRCEERGERRNIMWIDELLDRLSRHRRFAHLAEWLLRCLRAALKDFFDARPAYRAREYRVRADAVATELYR
jgi:hypothetical protein